MKKILIACLSLILISILCGCSNNITEEKPNPTENKEQSTEEVQVKETVQSLEIGQPADYSFGSFTISGFKRDGDKLYYSISIIPKNNGANQLELDGLSYYFSNISNRLPKETIQLNGDQYQALFTIASNKVAEINAISLKYNDVEAKWNLDINMNEAGDVNYIDNNLAQAQQNQQLQSNQQETQTQQQTVLIDDQQSITKTQSTSDISKAWPILNQYGKEIYPDGFELNYSSNEMTEEKLSDGTWFLRSDCTLNSLEGEKVSAICEAIVEYYDGNWDILSFQVY